MTTKRRIRRRHNRTGNLTPEVIDAWMTCDRKALHCALGLGGNEASPLPYEITVSGVTDDDFDAYRASVRGDGPWSRSLKKAAMLQRQLLKAAGWPDCRQAYEENLEEARKDVAHCRDLIEHPERRSQGTGSDLASLQKRLQQCEEQVVRRRQLLDELAETQEQWRPKARVSEED